MHLTTEDQRLLEELCQEHRVSSDKVVKLLDTVPPRKVMRLSCLARYTGFLLVAFIHRSPQLQRLL